MVLGYLAFRHPEGKKIGSLVFKQKYNPGIRDILFTFLLVIFSKWGLGAQIVLIY